MWVLRKKHRIYLEAIEISVLKNGVQSILFVILLLHTITMYEYTETTRRRKMYMCEGLIVCIYAYTYLLNSRVYNIYKYINTIYYIVIST